MSACQMLLTASICSVPVSIHHAGGSFSQNRLSPGRTVRPKHTAHALPCFAKISASDCELVTSLISTNVYEADTQMHIKRVHLKALHQGSRWLRKAAPAQGISTLRHQRSTCNREVSLQNHSVFSDFGKETTWYALAGLSMTLPMENFP